MSRFCVNLSSYALLMLLKLHSDFFPPPNFTKFHESKAPLKYNGIYMIALNRLKLLLLNTVLLLSFLMSNLKSKFTIYLINICLWSYCEYFIYVILKKKVCLCNFSIKINMEIFFLVVNSIFYESPFPLHKKKMLW